MPMYLTCRLNTMAEAFATADQLSTTFAALADPTRRAILARLASGETSVSELAEPFEMSMPAISKHLKVLQRAGVLGDVCEVGRADITKQLKVLQRAGLIERGREAQWRPCRLAAGPLKDASDWLHHHRPLWGGGVARRGDYLR